MRKTMLYLAAAAVLLPALALVGFYIIGGAKDSLYCKYEGKVTAEKTALSLLAKRKTFSEKKINIDELVPKFGAMWESDGETVATINFSLKSDGRAFARMILTESQCDLYVEYFLGQP